MRKVILLRSFKKPASALLNPDIAYSLRRVSDVYSGDYIRVRKVGGAGGEMSFGLVNGVVDVAAIEAFLNGRDGRVTRIYNVGSNLLDVFDLRQSAVSDQPFIARNGVVEVENGLPIIDFGGGTYFLEQITPNAAIQDKDSLASHVFKSQSGLELGGVFEEVSTVNGNNRIVQFSDTRTTLFRHSNYAPQAANPLSFSSQQPTNTLRQYSLERSGNTVNGYAESNLIDTITSSQGFTSNTRLALGRQDIGPLFFNGKWFETLIWASDNYDRNLIENNQINYYGV